MKYDMVHRFEDIESWKIARLITSSIYDISNNVLLNNNKSFYYQICRAALSIMNNIAEGFDRGSNKDFIKFLFIAKAS